MTQDGGVGSRERPAIRDFWPRVLLSPVIGAVIANISGLIDNSRHSPAGLIASYLYFSLISFVIWTGNRWFYFRLQHREDWLEHPWRRLARLLAAIFLYTIPVVTVLMLVWRAVTGDPGARTLAIPYALLGTITGVVIITHVYETLFLLRDWESDRLRSARLNQARLEAELEALGREVDPHFLFNNLNALAHLVEQRSDQAVPFVNALSATYRYVLESRHRRLVPLATELEALERLAVLARIRYRNGFVLRCDVDTRVAGAVELPPVALAELFQNAIKHNDLSVGPPLAIDVRLDGQTLVFENEYRPHARSAASTGMGLSNLQQRFALSTGGRVSWRTENGRYVVRVPLARRGSSRIA